MKKTQDIIQAQMKIKITQPPIPILWLDTWFIFDLVSALNGSSPEKKVWAKSIVDTIVSLTNKKKIVCPEGDQGAEIELSNNQELVQKAKRLQAQLSRGISMHFHATVEHLQTQRMMQAVIRGEKEVIFPWEDIFIDDLIKKLESKEKWIVNVHSNPSKKHTERTIKTNKSIAKEWEKLRKKARKNKQTYVQTLEFEFKGKSEAMMHIMALLATKVIHNKKLVLSDLLKAHELVGKPLGWWERYSGKQDIVNDVLSFYRSDAYAKIPSVNIGCRLLAKLACGNEAASASDVMDIHHVSTVFPFATYIVVDNRVRNRIEQIKLHHDYNCKIIRWKDILTLLQEVESK